MVPPTSWEEFGQCDRPKKSTRLLSCRRAHPKGALDRAMTGNTPSPTPFSSSLSFTSTHAYKPHIRSDEEPSGRRRGCVNNILPERTDFALPSIRQLSAAVLLQQQQQQQGPPRCAVYFNPNISSPPEKSTRCSMRTNPPRCCCCCSFGVEQNMHYANREKNIHPSLETM